MRRDVREHMGDVTMPKLAVHLPVRGYTGPCVGGTRKPVPVVELAAASARECHPNAHRELLEEAQDLQHLVDPFFFVGGKMQATVQPGLWDVLGTQTVPFCVVLQCSAAATSTPPMQKVLEEPSKTFDAQRRKYEPDGITPQDRVRQYPTSGFCVTKDAAGHSILWCTPCGRNIGTKSSTVCDHIFDSAKHNGNLKRWETEQFKQHEVRESLERMMLKDPLMLKGEGRATLEPGVGDYSVSCLLDIANLVCRCAGLSFQCLLDIAPMWGSSEQAGTSCLQKSHGKGSPIIG